MLEGVQRMVRRNVRQLRIWVTISETGPIPLSPRDRQVLMLAVGVGRIKYNTSNGVWCVGRGKRRTTPSTPLRRSAQEVARSVAPQVAPTRRLNDAPGLPKPTFALRGRRNEHSKYIIAPALLTGNPVGVNAVHADQHASDRHRIGG
jgi:hypothetical protein